MVYQSDPAPLPGWLMFHSQRHLHSPASMNAAERASYGPTIGHMMELLEEATGCERIYMTAFGESFPHLHAHLIPRYSNLPDTHAWAIADHYRGTADGSIPMANAKDCAACSDKLLDLLKAKPPPTLPEPAKL
jgi:diadenosine tetraphosphate (Ap4A) HIT family hydrolase